MHKFPLPIHDIKTKAELDLSGKELNSADAIVLASLLPLNGTLTKLDISKNGIRGTGMQAIARALKGNQIITELDVSSSCITEDEQGQNLDGIVALADVVKGMQALTKLDISNNDIKQGEALQQITEYCKTKGIKLLQNEEPTNEEAAAQQQQQEGHVVFKRVRGAVGDVDAAADYTVAFKNFSTAAAPTAKASVGSKIFYEFEVLKIGLYQAGFASDCFDLTINQYSGVGVGDSTYRCACIVLS
jgi:hypothetical protein